jgi:rod shape determining protein RodA
MTVERINRYSLVRKFTRRFGVMFFTLLISVTLFGIIVIYGATYSIPELSDYARKQTLWLLVSLSIYTVISLLDYRWLRHLVWPIYAFSILLLILLVFLGHQVKGAKSWYDIGTHRIQPSEFAKIAVILCLAHCLAWREKPLTRIRDILAPVVIVALPMALILYQPDIGTASLFFPLLLIMIYAGGASHKLILLCVLMAVWGTLVTYPMLKPYQKARIKVFFNPEHDTKWQGYNIRQAEISLGSGGLLGKGWKAGTQTRLSFLPERHTDFIFSSLGEQFGFVGCGLLLLLYGLITARAHNVARNAPDKFGRLLVTGILGCFLIHVFCNMGMSLRLLPVTGLPLPFFSYGGSFLLTNYILFAIVQSVSVSKGGYQALAG